MTTKGWVESVKAAVGIEQALRTVGLQARRMSSFGPCPLCGEDARGTGDSRGPIGVGRDRGKWHCWRCNQGGDAIDLVAAVKLQRTASGLDAGGWSVVREECVRLGWVEPEGSTRSAAIAAARPKRLMRAGDAVRGKTRPPEPAQADPGEERGSGGGRFGWSPTLADECETRLWQDEGEAVREYLTAGRKLSEATIRAFRLGAFPVRDDHGAVREWWVTIPLVDAREEVANVRFRSVPGRCGWCDGKGCDRCKAGEVKKQYRVCTGRPLPLYGADRLSDDLGSAPIVVEGELDVVAMFEMGWTRNVVSGTAGAGAWKDEWLDQLEPYSAFIVAYDNDEAGDKGADGLVEKLGRYRCSRARLPFKDAGECLTNAVPEAAIVLALDRAQSSIGIDLFPVGHYGAQIERLIEAPGDLVGRPTGSTKLDTALGGVRPGLIVVTGETGEGKTTFATWLLGQAARAGVPSLLTSFEQSPVGTVQKLLRSELGGDFVARTKDERRAAIEALDALPLWIVDHRGSMSFEDLLNTIRFAVRRRGVRNVLVDHLGFVIDPEAEDERREIQNVVRALSIIAEHEGVSIILVCHPSNMHVAQRRRVSLADLKGASAIRQDAHEVWVVEAAKPNEKRPWPGAWIHLDKVRSDFGASGASVLLAFDPLACVYCDTWDETPSGRKGIRVVVPTKKRQREPEAEPSSTRGKRGARKPAGSKDAAASESSKVADADDEQEP